MRDIEDFLSLSEEEEIIEAIRQAELKTSGEIRIHIERTHPDQAIDRARSLFHFLKMDTTALRNGVLIYISVEDHEFAIYGDQGIHEKVKSDFWNKAKEILGSYFSKGHFKNGLIKCVEEVASVMEEFFPWDPYDSDELPNTITTS